MRWETTASCSDTIYYADSRDILGMMLQVGTQPHLQHHPAISNARYGDAIARNQHHPHKGDDP
jgi:hypothetical protein